MDILDKIKSGKYRIINTTGSSVVWKYFCKIKDVESGEIIPFVKCVNCEKIFKFGKGASSSNLKKHFCYKTKLSTEEIDSEIQRKRPLIDSNEQFKEEILQNCVKYTYRDLRSFELINGEGFKDLARCLVEYGVQIGTTNFSIDNILPQSATISNRLQEMLASERERFINYISTLIEQGMCAATVDMWQDRRKQRNFTTLTVHYLDDSWRLQNRILFTTEFENDDGNNFSINRTAENIITAIEMKFDELKLDRKLLEKIIFTTDQDSNIKKAFQQHSRINCCIYILNTIVKNTFHRETLNIHAPNVLDLIRKCTLLVENLRRTGREHVLEINMMNYDCTTPSPSRWQTQFDILCSVHKNFQTIKNLLDKSMESHLLYGIESSLMTKLINILEAFRNLTLLLADDKIPTIHFVLLQMHILKEKLRKMLQEENNNEIRSIISICLDIFDLQFCPDRIHKISAFLWPEFKQMRYLSTVERDEVYSLVQTELKKISKISTEENYNDFMPSQLVEAQYSIGDDLLAKYKDVNTMTVNTPETNIQIEFETYKNSCYTEKSSLYNSILYWWRRNENKFPLISKLARQLLCIPASSAASERCFSGTNRILEERRISLDSENIDAILFLHSQQETLNAINVLP